jgi:hypothetical protein
MDCCRDYFPMAPLTPVPFDTRADPRAPDRVKYHYGFATKWKRRSRERPINGATRGVFTTTLLEGLRGGASEGGRITAASLRAYLNEYMEDHLDPADKDDPSVPKQPECTQFPSAGDGLVIVENLAPTLYDVSIHLPAGPADQTVQILDSRFKPLASQAVAPGGTWQLRLAKGLYLAQVMALAKQQDFEVRPEGGAVDVQL